MFMEKKKKYGVRMLIIVIVLIILIVLALFLRKAIIISSLENKAEEYANSNNFYMKKITYTGDVTTNEYYKKDDKTLMKMQTIMDEKVADATMVENNGKMNFFLEVGDKKVAKLDQDLTYNCEISYLDTENLWELLKISMFSRVDSVMFNGKECYRVINDSGIITNEIMMYIDKETGLIVREVYVVSNEDVDYISDYEYSFDTVKDEDVVGPNVTEYSIN